MNRLLLVLLLAFSCGASAQPITSKFQIADAVTARAFILQTLAPNGCGTAVASLNERIDKQGIPDDIYIAPDGSGWKIVWVRPDGITTMFMRNVGDKDIELCRSQVVYDRSMTYAIRNEQ